jgi:NAD(P)-dependent dehydrogenase (short-subunit alcohol dehydrogenase family)
MTMGEYIVAQKSLFDLSGRTAVITGASGILGRHFSFGLAEAGANIALIDIQSKAVEELASEIAQKYDVKVQGFVCDVSNSESVKVMVKDVVASFGHIEILHNNAAGKSDDLEAFFTPFEDYSLAQWRQIMAVNLDGMFLVAQAIGKQMVAQGSGGSIIQTSSIYGLMGPDQRIYENSFYLGRQINTPAVYSASKAGVIGLTKYLSAYWAPQGIRVNAIAPGGAESGQNDEFIRRYSQRIPMGRMAQAHEIVGALLYLASDASSYVTGQIIAVDGGLSAW